MKRRRTGMVLLILAGLLLLLLVGRWALEGGSESPGTGGRVSGIRNGAGATPSPAAGRTDPGTAAEAGAGAGSPEPRTGGADTGNPRTHDLPSGSGRGERAPGEERGGGKGDGTTTPGPGKRRTWDPALGTGTIVVRTLHVGDPVPRRRIKMEADEVCRDGNSAPVLYEGVLEGPDGALANVVAWISRGVEGFFFETPEDPVLLDQRGCLYRPRVLTLMTGQPLTIRNSDPTMHNIHGLPRLNRGFNLAQVKGSADQTVSLVKPEVGIRVKCDVHSWMEGWIAAFDHPFHGVTAADGRVTLPKVPAGTYTVSVWHEYGKFTTPDVRSVTVKDGETVEMNFTFTDRETGGR